MTPIPKFPGKIKGGKLTLVSRANMENYLAALPDGDYELIIRKKSEVRSIELNNYFHGVVLALISEHTGYTKDEAKEIMKVDHGAKDEFGHPVSTSKYTTKQMMDFIDEIRRFWAENDLYIPDPGAAEASHE